MGPVTDSMPGKIPSAGGVGPGVPTDDDEDMVSEKQQALRPVGYEIQMVEEEMKTVQNQRKELEDQIRVLEDGVREVRGEIQSVEREISSATEPEARKMLEKKLEDLRGDKRELGQRILVREQLILVLEQERVAKQQATGNLTRTEWLNQRLPPFLCSFSTQPGLRKAKDEILPASTMRWDLWPDVEQYFADAVAKSSRHQRIDIQFVLKMKMGASNEADCSFVYQSLLGSMGLVLLGDECKILAEECSRSSSIRQQHTTADISRGALNDPSADLNNVIELARINLNVRRVDIQLKYKDRIFLSVEMKRPSYFRKVENQNPPDLVEAYEGKDLPFLDGQRFHVLAQSITQLFTYLVRLKIGYGIISSADLSYLVSRVGDSLRISEGIHWRHPKLIRALAYIMEKAADDTTQYEYKGGGKHSQDYDIDDSEETKATPSDHDEYHAPKKVKVTEADRRVTRSMKGVSGLKETPAAHLHLEAHPFATGWSGNIVRGTYEGHVVAVKLAVVCSDRAEALINEASAYLKLQKYWGKYVPALVSHGTTADGNVVYVATELIKGYELGMGLTPEVVTASFEALNAIHAFGILHGDIRRENILVPKGGRRGVRFIDFGFARSIASAEDCCKELAQLQDIVSKLCSRSSGRVASTAGVIDGVRSLEAEAY